MAPAKSSSRCGRSNGASGPDAVAVALAILLLVGCTVRISPRYASTGVLSPAEPGARVRLVVVEMDDPGGSIGDAGFNRIVLAEPPAEIVTEALLAALEEAGHEPASDAEVEYRVEIREFQASPTETFFGRAARGRVVLDVSVWRHGGSPVAKRITGTSEVPVGFVEDYFTPRGFDPAAVEQAAAEALARAAEQAVADPQIALVNDDRTS